MSGNDSFESDDGDLFLARVARAPEAPPGIALFPQSLLGRVLGDRFRLVEIIGKGGMGIVFRAVQTPVERDVAVKILRPALGEDEQAVARFESEARIIAGLRHPNVVKLIDFGRSPEGLPFMVTELLDGAPLSAQIDGTAWREEKIRWILYELCDALAEAHSKGIVHRDLKPSNIFLEQVEDQKRVKILDFGIAKLRASSQTTGAGVMIGTPTYMAPEQTRGDPIDGRADLYSLGIIAYECLTGRPPFVASDPEALVLQHRNDPPPSLKASGASVSPDFARIVFRLLEKSPHDRMSARDLREALDEPFAKMSLTGGSSSTPRFFRSSASARAAFAPHARLGRRAWMAFGLTVTAGTAAVVFGGFLDGRSPEAAFQRPARISSPATPSLSESAKQSIAVLPFEDLSAEKDQAYFARGISDELLNVLARSKGLRVPSRTSSFAFQERGLPVPEIAKALGVAHILEGSIRRSGETVRVTVNLIDTRNDSYLWSETYDRPLTMGNLLQIQRETAQAIVGALKLKLTVMPSPTSASISLESFELFCRAREYIGERTPEALRMARDDLNRVVDQSPTFAPGYALLAETIMLLAVYTGENLAKAVPESEALVARALELDDQSAEALVTRAALEFMKPEQDLVLAIDYARRAVAVNPNHATAYLRLAEALSSHGRAREALKAAKAARQLDPMSPVIGSYYSKVLLANNDLEEARRQARHVVRSNPSTSFGYAALRDIEVVAGRFADAFGYAQDAHAMNPGGRYANRNYYADVMLAYLTGYESADLPEAYLALRRGDRDRLEALIKKVRFPLHRAYLRYRQHDFERARKVLGDWMSTAKLEQKTVQSNDSVEILLLLEDIYRRSGGSPPFIMNALTTYFAESRPHDLKVGRYMLCRAKFEILAGRPEKALPWIERALDLQFVGDFLDEPVFDELRQRPKFADYLALNRELVLRHHQEIDRLIANPRQNWVAPIGRVYEQTAQPAE